MMGYNLPLEGVVFFLVVVSIQGTVVVRPPAMYVFGDSTLDVGNNEYLTGKDVVKANKPYYGIDFPGFPAGRFSNGWNTADLVAMSMGFIGSPPAYLSLARSSSLLALTALNNGVNYAAVGAGIFGSTHAGNTIPLSKQLQYFSATKAGMVARRGSGAVDALLSNSIFLVGIGSNDSLVFPTTKQSDIPTFYSNLIANYSAAITRLRNPIGACGDALNQLVAGFNGELSCLLSSLAPKLPGLVYSLGDFHGVMVSILSNPWAFGFTDVASACCGSGRLNAEGLCLPSSRLCTNRDQHIYWDPLHHTQRARFIAARTFYDGPAWYTKPINFKQFTKTLKRGLSDHLI